MSCAPLRAFCAHLARPRPRQAAAAAAARRPCRPNPDAGPRPPMARGRRLPAGHDKETTPCTQASMRRSTPSGPPSSWPAAARRQLRRVRARSNRLAHLLRAQGLQRLDHYAMFMENNSRYLEACVAGERAGLYYTCINSYLKADELAYILDNSESRVLITSRGAAAGGARGAEACPLCAVPGGRRRAGPAEARRPRIGLRASRRGPPRRADRRREPGHLDAVFVGHDRAAQGHPAAAARAAAQRAAAAVHFLHKLWHYREAWSTCRRRRCTTRRRCRRGEPDAAQRRHRAWSWSTSTPSSTWPGRASTGHALAAGADDVQPHAQAAARGAARGTTCRRWRSPSTPPRPARCR
jgi:hypothetical protein